MMTGSNSNQLNETTIARTTSTNMNDETTFMVREDGMAKVMDESVFIGKLSSSNNNPNETVVLREDDVAKVMDESVFDNGLMDPNVA